MEKRVQRYAKEIEEPKKSRTSKNKYLYDEINNKIGYDEIVNLDTQTKIDLSELTGSSVNREEYQKTKDYKQFYQKSEEPKEELKTPKEEKIYDINSILEEARKNREKYDELERKRKLKENDYVTLADINKKDEYKRENLNIDEKELTDLINTITSHNLLNEIKEAEKKETKEDKNEDLFSDLMATDVNVNLEGIAEEYTKEEEKIDDSFYTKSMDLSDQDFEFSEELEQEKKNKIKVLIIGLVVLIIIIITIVGVLILKTKGII